MVLPKQEILIRDESSSDSSDTTMTEQPLFGSQLVDENSPTPYSDATQVLLEKKFKLVIKVIFLFYNTICLRCWVTCLCVMVCGETRR